jgi:hypothetical protein
MSVPAMSDSAMTSVFIPNLIVRRPTLEQVLQQAATSKQLLSPTRGDVRFQIPTYLLDGVSSVDVEGSQEREKLYKGERDLK